MKTLGSMACVAACVSRGRAGQLEKDSQAGHPNLIIASERVDQYRAGRVRTWTFGQATLAEYGMGKGSVADGELVGAWKWVSG